MANSNKRNQLEVEISNLIDGKLGSKDAFKSYTKALKSLDESKRAVAPSIGIRALYFQNQAIFCQNELIIDYLKELNGEQK